MSRVADSCFRSLYGLLIVLVGIFALSEGVRLVGEAVSLSRLEYWFRFLRSGLLAYLVGILLSAPHVAQGCTGFSCSRYLRSRFAIAVVFAWVGLEAGSGYFHLCLAGSRLIEGGAALGTPVVVGSLVFFPLPRRRILGRVIAGLLILVVWLLREPYLTWVHGG